MEDLPDEVLELILSKVGPYEDGESCACVCSRWRRTMEKVILRRQSRFMSDVLSGALKVTHVPEPDDYASIAKRYSHSAVYHEKGLFVFGGCTSTSRTFNDLWRLDLNSRTWTRMLTTGHYPLPKASASLVAGKEELILFGGWSFLSLFPEEPGSTKLLSELHFYSTKSNKWTRVPTDTHGRRPPGSAGHSASIQGDHMIVFGGLQEKGLGVFGSSNDVWIFHLPQKNWSLLPQTTLRPHSRFGHSQIKLSEDSFMIMGGSDRGPNGNFHDVWLFNMAMEPWSWFKCEVVNSHWAPTELWCHPACRIGDYVVILSMGDATLPQEARHPQRRDEQMEGGPVQQHPQRQRVEANGRPHLMGERMQAFATQSPSRITIGLNKKSKEMRQKQLETLKKLEHKLLRGKTSEKEVSHPEQFVLHTLDVSKAISDHVVTWLQIKTSVSPMSPEETLFYSLVPCRSELVMFGGVQMDASSIRTAMPYRTNESVSNSTYYFNSYQEII